MGPGGANRGCSPKRASNYRIIKELGLGVPPKLCGCAVGLTRPLSGGGRGARARGG